MKVLSIITWSFLLLGAAFLGGAFYLYQSTSAFLGKAARAEGTVIELERFSSGSSPTYRPVVRFTTLAGRTITFRSSVGSNPPDYEQGETVGVFYLPDEPKEAAIDGFFSLWGLAVIFGAIGGVLFLVGAGILRATLSQKKKQALLQATGMPIEAEFVRVELNTSVSVNGSHPYRIVAQWLDPSTSLVRVLTSDDIWFDPTNYIQSKTVTVLIDKNDPSTYMVDLSFLPKPAL